MAITGNLQIKNNVYYAVINLYDENGKRKPKWFTTHLKIRGNKKKAEEFLRQKLDEFNKLSIPYSDITVAKYFENWLNQIKDKVKPNTYRAYYSNMTNHIIPYFSNKKILLQELKPVEINKYYEYKQTNDKLSNTSIKHHHQNISKALADAMTNGLIMYNPASAAKPPKQQKFKAEFLNTKQIEQMLILFKNTEIELPVTLCAIYGLRRSEVLGLKWNCVDFENKTITICETLQQNTGGDYTSTTKTESSNRTLPLTNSALNLLKNHKKKQEELKKIMGKYYIVNDYVCTRNNGEYISPNYLTRSFHSIITKSDLPQIRLHDLRHSVASNLLNNGMTVLQVQYWLGHSSSATTLNFYAHIDKTSKEYVANAIDNMIAIS